MPARGGFWSYVHADDLAEGGRIRQLADDLAEQYALVTGESINIFVDRDAIGWGDDWRERINASLASILFFVAVITPRYFTRPECRRELQEFARGAQSLGIRELVLPLVYVDVPALHEDEPVDEAIALVKTYQWEDWREIRFEDTHSGAYRRAVAQLAQRLVDANQSIISEDAEHPSDVAPTAPEDGQEPGTLDLLAAMESAMPELTETLQKLGPEVEHIGNLAQQAAENANRSNLQGGGFSARLAIARRLAQQLSEPADHIVTLANQYTRSLYDVDVGVRTIIDHVPEEIKADPATKPVWKAFAAQIKELARNSRESVASLEGLSQSMTQVESMSRDLRPPLQNIRRGLTSVAEGSTVISEWERLVNDVTVN